MSDRIIKILFTLLLWFVATSIAVIHQENQKRYDYHCGTIHFSDRMVRDAMKGAAEFIQKQGRNQFNQGELYDHKLGYRLWPISKNGLLPPVGSGTYNIAFDNNMNVVNVVAKTSNSQFTNCIKFDPLTSSPVNYDEMDSNGYQCGFEFFTFETLDISLGLALVQKNKANPFPIAYTGTLYQNKPGLSLWPIKKEKRMYRFGQNKACPYFIVINSENKIEDVVVKTSDLEYVKCLKRRNIQSAPAHAPLSHLFPKPTQSGYLCNKNFYSDDYLIAAAEMAKETAKRRGRNSFPQPHQGYPCESRCLQWPIYPNGRHYGKGRAGTDRLALGQDFTVIAPMIIKKDGTIIKCIKKTIGGKMAHDKNDYECGIDIISNKQLLLAAEAGCYKIRNKVSNQPLHYPAKYVGPDFDVEGPYMTYPVFSSQIYLQAAGLHRVVMNFDCIVVGAITIRPNGRFAKCIKVGSSSNRPGQVDEQISEIFTQDL